MTITEPHSHSVPTIRLSALSRRITVSPSLASTIASLVYGSRERDHVEAIHLATAARVAAASVGAPS